MNLKVKILILTVLTPVADIPIRNTGILQGTEMRLLRRKNENGEYSS